MATQRARANDTCLSLAMRMPGDLNAYGHMMRNYFHLRVQHETILAYQAGEFLEFYFEDAKMRRCEDAKMRRCEDAKMRRCEDAKMRRSWRRYSISR